MSETFYRIVDLCKVFGRLGLLDQDLVSCVLHAHRLDERIAGPVYLQVNDPMPQKQADKV